MTLLIFRQHLRRTWNLPANCNISSASRGLISPVALTGIFLGSPDYVSLWSYSVDFDGDLITTAVAQDKAVIEKNIRLFKKFCGKNQIECSIREEDELFSLSVLQKETEFADLLLMSGRVFYQNLKHNQLDEYMQIALQYAECPVVLVPERFEFPSGIVLAYDGSKSSVFAIKQFTLLFPELCNSETLLLYANQDDRSIHDAGYIQEFASAHFPDLTFLRLNISSKKYFANWLKTRSNTMLVSGSFGHSKFSELLKKSDLTETIADQQVSVFIAHK